MYVIGADFWQSSSDATLWYLQSMLECLCFSPSITASCSSLLKHSTHHGRQQGMVHVLELLFLTWETIFVFLGSSHCGHLGSEPGLGRSRLQIAICMEKQCKTVSTKLDIRHWKGTHLLKGS